MEDCIVKYNEQFGAYERVHSVLNSSSAGLLITKLLLLSVKFLISTMDAFLTLFFISEMMSLYDQCMNVLLNNIDSKCLF